MSRLYARQIFVASELMKEIRLMGEKYYKPILKEGDHLVQFNMEAEIIDEEREIR